MIHRIFIRADFESSLSNIRCDMKLLRRGKVIICCSCCCVTLGASSRAVYTLRCHWLQRAVYSDIPLWDSEEKMFAMSRAALLSYLIYIYICMCTEVANRSRNKWFFASNFLLDTIGTCITQEAKWTDVLCHLRQE